MFKLGLHIENTKEAAVAYIANTEMKFGILSPNIKYQHYY